MSPPNAVSIQANTDVCEVESHVGRTFSGKTGTSQTLSLSCVLPWMPTDLPNAVTLPSCGYEGRFGELCEEHCPPKNYSPQGLGDTHGPCQANGRPWGS